MDFQFSASRSLHCQTSIGFARATEPTVSNATTSNDLIAMISLLIGYTTGRAVAAADLPGRESRGVERTRVVAPVASCVIAWTLKRKLCCPNAVPATTGIAVFLGRYNGVVFGVDSLRFPGAFNLSPAGRIARIVYEIRQLPGLEGMKSAA